MQDEIVAFPDDLRTRTLAGTPVRLVARMCDKKRGELIAYLVYVEGKKQGSGYHTVVAIGDLQLGGLQEKRDACVKERQGATGGLGGLTNLLEQIT